MSNEMSADQTDSEGQSDSVVPVVVLELIERSETIQGWMERLTDHADEAYTEVLERVKEDYRGRLDGVAGQLAEHRPDLVSGLDDRQGTVVSLRAERNSHEGDLEEARLRHAVGEFAEGEWSSRGKTIEGLLDRVDSLLEVEEGAVSEITAALERIDASGPPRSEVVFGSDGFVEVEHAPARPLARYGSRPTGLGLSVVPGEGNSDAAAHNPAARENGAADPDELDFLDAVTPDDIEKLDPISVATQNWA